MAWQYLSNLVINYQWQFLNPTSGNLLKLIHVTTLPDNSWYTFRGLIGRCLGNDFNSGIGEIRQLFFTPETQYYLFPPLPNEIENRFVLRGHSNPDSVFDWYTTAWIWDQKINDISSANFNNTISNIESTNQQQLEKINDIFSIVSNPNSGYNSGNNPNLYI